MVPETVDVEGIRHEPHVKHQIRLQGQAVLEAEGHQAHHHLPRSPVPAEQPQQLRAQPRRGVVGGVDHQVRLGLDRRHQPDLPVGRLLQGPRLLLQRVQAAGLLVPVDNGPHVRLQKEQAAAVLPGAQR